MRTYGTVHTRFWVGDTSKELNDQGKLLFLYFLTCPHSNPIGCYRLPLAYISSDLKWGSETVTQMVHETVSKGLIEYDFEHEYLWIKNFLDFNPIANPNVAKGCIQYIKVINKKSPVYQSVVESLKPYAERFPKGYVNGLLNGYGNGMPNIEMEMDMEPQPNLNHNHNSNHNQAGAPKFLEKNNFDAAAACCCSVLGKKRLTDLDREHLTLWCMSYDFETSVQPIIFASLQKYMKSNQSKRPTSLAYFTPRIKEILDKPQQEAYEQHRH